VKKTPIVEVKIVCQIDGSAMIVNHSEFVIMKIEPFLQECSGVVAPIDGDVNREHPEAHAHAHTKQFGWSE
jgi:hypothetical protein